MKKTSIGILIVVGAIWFLAPFLLGLFGKAAAADRLTEALEPVFTDSTINQAKSDVVTVGKVTSELQEKTVPLIATVLNTTPEAVLGVVADNFPDVARLVSTTDNDGAQYSDGKIYLEHAASYLDDVTKALDANQENFDKSNAIPASFLPVSFVPVLFLLLGLVVLIAGFAGMRFPGTGGVIAAVVGVVVIVVVFALGLPGKTAALDDLTDAFRPVFTDEGSASIAEGAKYLEVVNAADKQLETEFVPALPGLLGLPLDDVVAALQENSPTVAAALLTKDADNPKVTALKGILDRFGAIAAPVAAGIDDFDKTDNIPGLGLPAKIVPWLLAVPGLLLVVAGLGLARKP